METRTAPRWIGDWEKRYRRTRWMWKCAEWLGWLGWAGWWVCLFLGPPSTALWNSVAGLCLVGWVALDHFKLEERAECYGAAADALGEAIAGYEASPDRPESTLTEAYQRACESLRLERIRTAPTWVRERRRQYRLRVLGCISPAVAALAFETAAAYFGWRWVRPGQILAAGLVLLFGGLLKAGRPSTASRILTEAIERYEFESAATESALDEEDRRASEALLGR